MSAYEFSMDQFVCYDRDQLDTFFDGETKYDKADYPEIFKNCDYKDKYTTLAAQDKYYHDTKANYDRTWRQAANLSLGICLLFVGIYYQK